MIRWYDGFDDLNGAEDVLFVGTVSPVNGGYGNPWGRANGGISVHGQSAQSPGTCTIPFFPSGSGVTEGGFAFWSRHESVAGRTNDRGMRFLDTAGNRKCALNHYTTGMSLEAASTSELDSTSWNFYAWNHWEIQFKIHATTGYLIVRLNTIEVMNETGLDTLGTGDAEVCSVDLSEVWTPTAYGNHIYDDFVLYDLAAPNQGWLGYHRIRPVGVDGAGASADFGLYPDSGEVNYENIDETVPDLDTTYNFSGVSTDLDDVALEDYAESGNIVAIAASVDAVQESVDTTQLKVGIITEGAATDEATFDVHSIDYMRKTHVIHNNPDDSEPWDVADLDGLKLKYEIA